MKSHFKDEFDEYIAKATALQKEAVVCESPHRITEMMLEAEQYSLRLGQIISEMTVQYAKIFSDKKSNGSTDKNCEALANAEMADLNGVSLKDYELLYKHMTKLVQAMKKRFQIIAFDYTQGRS